MGEKAFSPGEEPYVKNKKAKLRRAQSAASLKLTVLDNLLWDYDSYEDGKVILTEEAKRRLVKNTKDFLKYLSILTETELKLQ